MLCKAITDAEPTASFFAVERKYSFAHLLSQTITLQRTARRAFAGTRCRVVFWSASAWASGSASSWIRRCKRRRYQAHHPRTPLSRTGRAPRRSLRQRTTPKRPAPPHRGRARHLGRASRRHVPTRRHQRSQRAFHRAKLAPLCGAQGRCRFGLSPCTPPPALCASHDCRTQGAP